MKNKENKRSCVEKTVNFKLFGKKYVNACFNLSVFKRILFFFFYSKQSDLYIKKLHKIIKASPKLGQINRTINWA